MYRTHSLSPNFWIITLCLLTLTSGQTSLIHAQSKTTEDGRSLFTTSGCPQCHGLDGLGTQKAPSLRDVRKRKTEDQIRLQIKEGGKSMPPFGEALTDDQVSALVEFLRSKDGWNKMPVPSQRIFQVK